MTKQQRQPRRGREHVVRRLTHVDVIVGMDDAVFAARSAEQFSGTVGDHLVCIHVVRRTGAGLIDIDHELIAETTAENLVGGLGDRVPHARLEPAKREVRLCSGFLDQHGGVDEERGRSKPADWKVLQRANRLNAVVGVSRNRPFAERVAFCASGHGDQL